MVYLAESLALAALEILVHVERVEFMPAFHAIAVEIPERLITDLPKAVDPNDRVAAREYGSSRLLGAKSAVLRVPSGIIPQERLYLVNPRHSAASAITASDPVPFDFDPKVFVR